MSDTPDLDRLNELLAERDQWRANCAVAASVGDLRDRDVERLAQAERDLGQIVDLALPWLSAQARENEQLRADNECLRDELAHSLCPDCGHFWSLHSTGGMCGYEDEPCHCVMIGRGAALAAAREAGE